MSNLAGRTANAVPVPPFRSHQPVFGDTYEIFDENGENRLLSVDQTTLVEEGYLVGRRPDGKAVFGIRPGGQAGFPGDYTIIDPATDEAMATLVHQVRGFNRHWEVYDPAEETKRLDVCSVGKLTALRYFPYLARITRVIPDHYLIEAIDGEEIGQIKGESWLREQYRFSVSGRGDAPTTWATVVAIVIDVLDRNHRTGPRTIKRNSSADFENVHYSVWDE